MTTALSPCPRCGAPTIPPQHGPPLNPNPATGSYTNGGSYDRTGRPLTTWAILTNKPWYQAHQCGPPQLALDIDQPPWEHTP